MHTAMKYFLHFALFLLSAGSLHAALPTDRYFEDVTLAIDTNLYKLSQNNIVQQRKYQLYFEYSNRYTECELRFYPKKNSGIQQLSFYSSGGYEIVDSLIFLEDDGCYRGRLRFSDLFKNTQLSVLVNLTTLRDSLTRTRTWELSLFPYTQTWIKFFTNNDELFVGEEKSFELETNNADNIKLTPDWQTSDGVDYRVVSRNGRLQLILLPRELGVRTLSIEQETMAPFLDADKKLSNKITLTSQPLTVKASRLVFLNLDKQEVTFDDESRYKGITVTIDNHKRLQMIKTYRIEEQETPGGSLIGELFTIKELANDKVLCKLTVFNTHRRNDGYLYIKTGDTPQFITTLDITPQMQISAIYVLHDGEDWKTDNSVNPGETVDISIVGTSLHKARFTWQDAQDITSDTINQTETRHMFRLRIPMSINKRQVLLLNSGQPTGKYLQVAEYQRPRPFDFITLHYANKEEVSLSEINNVIISRSVIKDFTLAFDKSKIDSNSKLYGKQYFDLDVRVLGKKGEIIEMRTLKNQLVCPDESSPRGAYYKDKNCLSEDINLNSILNTKTSALDNFGKIQVDIRQMSDKYSEPVFEKRIEAIYQPRVLFDIDLSFPAGMLIQNIGKSESDSNTSFAERLSGISIALIAQLSFTDSEKAGKLKPWRCGAGFLFINTFNFSESAKRDLAFVAIGSIYPLSQRRMFNVPIHAGIGYKLQDKTPFVMISPGISISF